MNKDILVGMLGLLFVVDGCKVCETASDMGREDSTSIKGAELSIRCLGSVQETLYVDILSGPHKESFGVISAGPNGREGGATVGFSPMVLTEGLTVRWGVEGVDGLKRENRVHFDLSKHADRMKEVKAVVLVFSGGRKWELKAYNKWISAEDKVLLFVLQPIETTNRKGVER